MSSLFMRKRRPVGGYTNALAYDCINAIRHRAGLSSLSGLSGSGFADAVVQERAWEFAAERIRWF